MKNLTFQVRQRDLLEEFGVPDIQTTCKTRTAGLMGNIALMNPERAPFQCILGSVINKEKPRRLRSGKIHAVVSVMPVSTWTDMGFDRSDLITTNLRLAAANQGAIYVTGRTPIISLQLGGRHVWMSFLVVENLDKSDQFILGRDFVRNFDVTIDLNDGLIRIKDPERKYEKKPLNKILINQAKVSIFLDRKVRLKPNQAVVATFWMRTGNVLNKKLCSRHQIINNKATRRGYRKSLSGWGRIFKKKLKFCRLFLGRPN